LAVSVAGGGSSGFPSRRRCLGVRTRLPIAVTPMGACLSLAERPGRAAVEN
jgi:hypothetical protein